MTKRKPRSKQAGPGWDLSQGLDLELTPLQQEIAGLLLIALALITLLGLFSVSRGVVIDLWVRALRLLFGWGAYPAALCAGAAGVALFLKSLHREQEIRWATVIGWEITFVVLLALLHLLTFSDDVRPLVDSGEGGGVVGWALGYPLVAALGMPIATLVLLVVAGVGMSLALKLTWPRVREGSLRLGGALLRGLRALLPQPSSPDARPVSRPRIPSDEKERSSERGARGTSRRRQSSRRSRPAPAIQPQVELPPLDLLYDAPTVTFSEADVQRRARIIEEALESFGVPAKVVDIKQGPVVTQFGVEPGFVELRSGEQRKVRVNKIASLRDDLSLALAAAPIRIEAPVPGRPVVGIEVPNGETSLVSLREVMEAKAFRELDSLLGIALGRDVSGAPVVGDLAAMPHLLIAGATGSGKSKCIHAIITGLLCQNGPRTLKMVMIDPKRVELLRFNGLPHLIGRVETDMERVVGILKWLTQQMELRYQRFAETRVRHIDDYNRRVAGKKDVETMPYIVLVIDELADLMMMAPIDIERLICRLAQMARATGIHLILATQRPSVDVVTGLIKANFPARISFAVTSQVDSRVILDTPGADALLGSGDMLYMAPDSPKLERIQGCFVSDEEMESVVRFWKMALPGHVSASDKDPWEESMEDDSDLDTLTQEAIELVQQYKRASASFLQRRLRIGYPRAARLVEQLEELGVVGPAQDGGRSREVLIDTDEDLEAAELGLENVDS